MNLFTENKDLKFRPFNYTNNNINKNNNFMNYTPIHRKQDILNNNNQQKQDSYLDFSKNQNIPLNNFNPNLMKKSSNNHSIKNPTLNNNNRKGYLYNWPSSQNGPIKIKNEVLKKPTTPDQINHHKSNNYNDPLNSRYNYGPIQKSINYGSKTPIRNDNSIHNRPSTAHQKEKNHSLYDNNYNINKYGNIKRNINNNMIGPTKRLP